ncbi:hypothetical protein HK104_005803 [Borealophlyctis nickersoniae]|nr:hypothetical protein HK104_005803 [Borealophlyctis nickersoniae]
MIEADFVRLLAQMTRFTFGNNNMQKLCLHSLVRLISSMDHPEAMKQLTRLAEMNMVPLVSSCLRNEDVELASWAVFLTHEFVMKDVGRSEFSQMRGMAKTMANMLTAEETCIPRIVLRTLKYLGIRNEKFQKEMRRSGIIAKIVPCLKSADDETQCWALALLHDLLSSGEGHKEFIDADGLEALIDMSAHKSAHLSLYIADIFVFLCASVRVHEAIIKSSVLSAVFRFCKSDEYELQYAGTALLLNLATISGELINEMAERNGIELLTSFILESDKESLRSVSAKTLVTIASNDPALRFTILEKTITPLILHLLSTIRSAMESFFPDSLSPTSNHTTSPTPTRALDSGPRPRSSTSSLFSARRDSMLSSAPTLTSPHAQLVVPNIAESCRHLHGLLAGLYLCAQSEVFDRVATLSDGHDGEGNAEGLTMQSILDPHMEELCSAVLDLLLLPLVNEGVISRPGGRSVALSGGDSQDVSPEGGESAAGSDAVGGGADDETKGTMTIIEPEDDGDTSSTSSESSEESDAEQYSATREARDEVAINALRVISVLFKYETARAHFIGEKVFHLMASLLLENRKDLSEQAMIALALCAPYIPKLETIALFNTVVNAPATATHSCTAATKFYREHFQESVANYSPRDAGHHYVQLNVADRTPYLVISPQGWEIRNDSWTFESIRCTHPAQRGTKCAYEVTLRSEGIIQIGWASKSCVFDPEAGTGNNYGESWAAGDVVTAMIDLSGDKGQISYMRNGGSLGVAFVDIPKDIEWYPAISLASEQGCRVNFGDDLDPLQYLPSGYIPMAQMATATIPEQWAKETPEASQSPMEKVPIMRRGAVSHESLASLLQEEAQEEPEDQPAPTVPTIQIPARPNDDTAASPDASSPAPSNASSHTTDSQTPTEDFHESPSSTNQPIVLSPVKSAGMLLPTPDTPSGMSPLSDMGDDNSAWYYEIRAGFKGIGKDSFPEFGAIAVGGGLASVTFADDGNVCISSVGNQNPEKLRNAAHLFQMVEDTDGEKGENVKFLIKLDGVKIGEGDLVVCRGGLEGEGMTILVNGKQIGGFFFDDSWLLPVWEAAIDKSVFDQDPQSQLTQATVTPHICEASRSLG